MLLNNTLKLNKRVLRINNIYVFLKKRSEKDHYHPLVRKHLQTFNTREMQIHVREDFKKR